MGYGDYYAHGRRVEPDGESESPEDFEFTSHAEQERPAVSDTGDGEWE